MKIPPVNGCRYCGVPRDRHESRYVQPWGWHRWSPPTGAQRVERRRAHRDEARYEADPHLRARWWYWPPTQVTNPWAPRVMRASDEYGNPTVLIVVPLAGAFIVRTGQRPFNDTEENPDD